MTAATPTLTHRRHCAQCNAPFVTTLPDWMICIACSEQGRARVEAKAKASSTPARRQYVTAMAICREGDSPIYGETSMSIRVEDEAAGWFYVIHQERDGAEAEIHVELDDLRALLACAEEMAKQEPKE